MKAGKNNRSASYNSLKSTRTFFNRTKGAVSVIAGECKKCRRSPIMADSLLTDNFYLINRSAVIAGKELAGIRYLPFSDNGLPVVYEYLYSYCRYEKSPVSAESLTCYLEAVGKKNELSFAEAAAIVPLIKVCCIEIIAAELSSPKPGNGYARQIDILRLLSRERYPHLTEKVCRNERLLLTDSVYSNMDAQSKNEYRMRIEAKALRDGTSEETVINNAFAEAARHDVGAESHFGYSLFNENQYHYIELTLILTFAASVCTGLLFRSLILAVGAIFPFYRIIKSILDYVYSRFVRTPYLPRLELKENCPKTLITYITFFDDTLSIDRTAEALKRLSVTNKGRGMVYGFLADLRKSDACETEKDALICEYAEKKLNELNAGRGEMFFGAIRKRSYNFNTCVYEGHERKRGAICDFLHAVADGTNGNFVLLSGDISEAVYFAALDSDTVPEINSIKKLVGVLEHPLAQPVSDESGRIIVKGYGIAAPRMELKVSAWSLNSFTRLFGGFGGSEVYSDPSFSVYPVLYGEGTFAGKGVIRISSFNGLLTSELPENKILSHDAVESGYLRTAYVSDTVFGDTMPSDLLSYLKRAHRWIRGDVQNAIFIGKHSGMNLDCENPLSFLTRFKLADSIVRALTPVILAFTLHAGVLFPALSVLPLISLYIPFIIACAARLTAPVSQKEVFYGAAVLPALWRCFLSCTAETALLPAFAYNAADAIWRSVFRLIKDDKTRLLEWTTAAEADKQKSTFSAYAVRLWPQLFGAAYFFVPALVPLGILWLGAIIGAYLPTIEKKTKNKTPVGKTELSYAADMWKYFEDFINADNNWLPPDNFQEEPLNTDIRRTSPTNIGLALLSLYGGFKAGFITRPELYSKLEKSLSSVEKLEKYRGNLYNWYDTSSMTVLSPAFISFVDSGNFVCAMEALASGINEDGDIRAEKLVKRIHAITAATDLAFMYDSDSGLFHIGYEVGSDKLTESCYDLFAGEALLSSYFCICRGDVPAEHWRRLGRSVFESCGRMYVKSWAGTMFEYFLPAVFLPVRKYTFLSAMLSSAFSAQKKRNRNLPWGNSESGFYAFDEKLYYQYKAFGVKKLALKRGLDSENVISPYSSFLTMPFYPSESLGNLSALAARGMYGKYGFYESLDATPARTGGSPTVVKMYMTHHVSMGFLSLLNRISDGCIRKLFFSGDRAYFSELLEERLPSVAAVINSSDSPLPKERLSGRYTSIEHIEPSFPVCHAISDKKYTLMLTDSGCGYSEYKGMRINRFRADTGYMSRQGLGIFAAVKTPEGAFSATYAPVYDDKIRYKTYFGISEAVYRAAAGDVETRYSITVAPNSGCEIRTLSVRNLTPYRSECEVMFYFEPVLTSSVTEEAHPAFSGLFIYGSFEQSDNILTLGRRKRMQNEKSGGLSLTLYNEDGGERLFVYELTRFNILTKADSSGQGGEASFLNAFNESMNAVAGKTIPVDPCVCIKTELSLRPFGSEKVVLVIAADASPEASRLALKKLKKPSGIKAASDLRKMCLSELAAADADRESMKIADILLSAVIRGGSGTKGYTAATPSPYENIFLYGLCGELPIIFIRISETVAEKALVFLKAFSILRQKRIGAELLIGFSDENSYLRPVSAAVNGYINALGLSNIVGKRGGIFFSGIRNENDFALLAGICCFYADPEKGWRADVSPAVPEKPLPLPGKPLKVRYSYKTGIGGFVSAGNETGFALDDKEAFPNRPPWCHVLANRRFGTLVSDSDLGFTYAGTAALNRLTVFTNDIFRGNDGEKLILTIGSHRYDLIAGASPLYQKGRAVYMTECAGIRVKTEVFVCVSLSVKAVTVTLSNTSALPVRVDYDCRIIMGEKKKLPVKREAFQDRIEYTSPFAPGDRKAVALIYCPGGDTYGGSVGRGCSSGEKLSCSFIFAYTESERRKRGLLRLAASPEFIQRERRSVINFWNGTGSVRIQTPDKALDMFFNGFLQYQIKAARLYAKTGFYQCSGATGFRDQLQDTMALAFTQPELLKKQILLSCSRQFEKGDVLHWWHGGGKSPLKGSRTRSSDDLLWLPLAISEYVQRTGDFDLLSSNAPYVEGEELADSVSEAYIEVRETGKTATVYEHARMALLYGLKTGSHGLILFGSGDWNDGMNQVGHHGKGETVWGSFFAVIVLESFAKICEKTDKNSFAEYCVKSADSLRKAIETTAWDGGWYLRGFYDSGARLGSSSSDECRIDILPQSFAALAGGFDPYRVRTGLDNAGSCLVDRKHRTVKLLTPPFADGKNDPGYIMGYVPGVRENGGQYTHAAVWYAAALYRDCRYDEAYEILSLLNPVNKASDRASAISYRTEPYVLAGDVYSALGHEGMGGWTHYTGSAGWYYRTVINELLGLRISSGRLTVSPALPESWREYRAEINIHGAKLDIYVRKSRERKLLVDRKAAGYIPIDGKDHEIVYQYLPV